MTKLLVSSVFLILILTAAAYAQEQAQPTAFDWKALDGAWKTLENDATAETVDKLLAVLPTAAITPELKADPAAAPLLVLVGNEIGLLESMIIGENNRNAAKCAFRLLAVADPTLEAKIYKLIGNIIPFNARVFLEELNENRALVTNLEALLSSFKLDKPDDTTGHETARKLRYNAIDNIEEKALKAVKGECLKILKKL